MMFYFLCLGFRKKYWVGEIGGWVCVGYGFGGRVGGIYVECVN